MSRKILLKKGEEISRFSLTRLSREKLYGKKIRLAVDEQGKPCETRALSRDGAVLVAPGGYSQVYLTKTGLMVPSEEVQKVDREGQPLPVTESTLNVPQEIQETTPDRILEHCTAFPYHLTPEEIDPDLERFLNAGAFFETVFAYRKGSTLNPAFLLKNEQGYFLLVCSPHNFSFCSPDQQIVEEDDENEDPFTEDFDFGML